MLVGALSNLAAVRDRIGGQRPSEGSTGSPYDLAVPRRDESRELIEARGHDERKAASRGAGVAPPRSVPCCTSEETCGPGRSATCGPPKLVTLNNALLAVVDPRGIPDPFRDAPRYGAWVENACLAHAWNAGQSVSYWREEPFEVDAVLEGSWGAWVLEVKTGSVTASDLRALGEFTRRFPKYDPLVRIPPIVTTWIATS